jgi:hypothetical protein
MNDSVQQSQATKFKNQSSSPATHIDKKNLNPSCTENLAQEKTATRRRKKQSEQDGGIFDSAYALLKDIDFGDEIYT